MSDAWTNSYQPAHGPVVPPPSAESARRSGRLRPHLGALVGAVGGAMTAFGLIALLGELVDGNDGAVLAALVAAGGAVLAAVLLVLARGAGGASAGSTSLFLLVPVPVALLLTLEGAPDGKAAASILTLYAASAWFLLHVAGPARGRPVFLAGALLALWALLVIQTLPSLEGEEFAAPLSARGTQTVGAQVSPPTFTPPTFEPPTFEIPTFAPPTFDFPSPDETIDLGTLQDSEDEEFNPFGQLLPFGFFFGDGDVTGSGVVSLILGLAYLAAGVVCDRRGWSGTGTPFFGVGIAALAASVGFLAPELGAAGSGITALLLGAALAAVGVIEGRRGTAWAGGLAAFVGVGVLIDDLVDDSTGSSAVLLVIGIGLAAAAYVYDTVRPDAEVFVPVQQPTPGYAPSVWSAGAEEPEPPGDADVPPPPIT